MATLVLKCRGLASYETFRNEGSHLRVRGGPRALTGRHSVRVPMAFIRGKILVGTHIGPTERRGQLGCEETRRTVELEPGTRPKLQSEKRSILSTRMPVAKLLQRLPIRIVGGLLTVSVLAQLM